MEIESIHTYFNATDINIYKQMEQIFTNIEHNIDIIKGYSELCKENLIAEIIIIVNICSICLYILISVALQYVCIDSISISIIYRCYKKRYNNMNLNNIITHFKTMSNEVITFCPEIQTLLKLLMVSPASSCDAERSFSALRRLNTWLRNSMKQRRLNSIMICNIHKENLKNYR